MLFNSLEFLFLYLPLVFVFFVLLGRIHRVVAEAWLVAASIYFHGYFLPQYTYLLIFSILVNYGIGLALSRFPRSARLMLTAGIVLNLSLLGYYKYGRFFVENANALAGTHVLLPKIALPLAISFYTFTQIAYLVDTYQGKVRERNLLHYALFVTYFPHLIAGPILHHKEMMPQFKDMETYRLHLDRIAAGTAIFVIGLAKKVLFADEMKQYVVPAFDAARMGAHLAFVPSWAAALAYTLQLYFDFSGYSDMAIGVSLLFNIHLPVNFNSPYKARNLADFWQRWHMTLSRFLRDYVYIPLGGNRKGPALRYVNLIVTMFLGGLWHGAAWTFVVWGCLHGAGLAVSHAWTSLRSRGGGAVGRPAGMWLPSRALTFVFVVFGWVLFRSDSIATASVLYGGMLGRYGFGLPVWEPAVTREALVIAGLLAIAWCAPNTLEIVRGVPAETAKRRIWQWRPTPAWGVAMSILFFALALTVAFAEKRSDFIYFNF